MKRKNEKSKRYKELKRGFRFLDDTVKKEKRVSTHQLKSEQRHFGFDPVDLISGAYTYHQTDFETKGQIPLNWSWKWTSNSNWVGSLGNRILFIYDEHLEIDAENQLLFHIDGNGQKTEFPWLFDDLEHFDTASKLHLICEQKEYILKKAEQGQICRFVPNKQNPMLYNMSEISNQSGFKLQLLYDEQGRLKQLIDSNQQIFIVNYNLLGFIQSLSVNDSVVSYYDYSEMGNLISVTDVDGYAVTFTYDDNYLMVQRKDKNGMKFHWQYDDLGRVTHTWGDGHIQEGWIEYHQDQGYNLVTDYYGGQTKYRYNKMGLVEEIAFAQGGFERYFYNKQNLITRFQSAEGRIMSYIYDERGWLVEKESNDGQKESYRYEEDGTLAAPPPDEKEKYRSDFYQPKIIESDEFGRVSYVKEKDVEVSISYNSLGLIIQKRRVSGDKEEFFSYLYDKRNRLLVINRNNQLFRKYKYNTADQIVELATPDIVLSLSYDKNGKVTMLKNGHKTFRLSHDFNGRLLRMKDSNETVLSIIRNEAGQIIEEISRESGHRKFEYNLQGRVSKVLYSEEEWLVADYNHLGNILEIIFSDKTWERYEYDAFGQIRSAANLSSKLEMTYNQSHQMAGERISFEDLKMMKVPTFYKYDRDDNIDTLIIGQLLKEYYWKQGTQRVVKSNPTKHEPIKIQVKDTESSHYVLENKSKEVTVTVIPENQEKVLEKRSLKKPVFYGSGLLSIADDKNNKPVVFQYDCFGRLIEVYSAEALSIYVWAQDRIIFEIVILEENKMEIIHWCSEYESKQLLMKNNLTIGNCYIEDGKGNQTEIFRKEMLENEAVIIGCALKTVKEVHLPNTGVYYSYQKLQPSAQENYSNNFSINNVKGMLNHFSFIQLSKASLEKNPLESSNNLAFFEKQNIFLTMFAKRFFLKNIAKEYENEEAVDLKLAIIPEQGISGLEEFGILLLEELLEENIRCRMNNYFNR